MINLMQCWMYLTNCSCSGFQSIGVEIVQNSDDFILICITVHFVAIVN